MSYIFPIELDKSSDDLHTFPQKYVLALSILGLMRGLDNQSTAGFVSDTPSLAQDHFPHSESAGRHVSWVGRCV